MKEKETGRSALDRIRIVLVKPKQPGNIGAVARAMKNMGLSRLYLVGPAEFRSGGARKMAHGSGDILYSAIPVQSLGEALAGTVLAVGTTHRRRRDSGLLSGPKEAARRLVSLPEGTEGALVFGCEESGLSNAELQICQTAARIPTACAYPSFNLAQAVLIFAYELYQAAAAPGAPTEHALASFSETESMYAHISLALDKLGFAAPNRPQAFMRSVRRLFGRAPLERRDVATVHRIFRQIDRFASRHGLDDSGPG